MSRMMIYGANGYTGRLIAREAVKRGLKPMLAGRNRDEIAQLSSELTLPHRAFELARPPDIERNLEDILALLEPDQIASRAEAGVAVPRRRH